MSKANRVTAFRIFLTPLFAAVLIFEGLVFKYLSLFIFIVASITDWYDGYLARKSNSITSTGKYLDPLADKLLISTAFGIFTYKGYVAFWMFATIVFRDIVITGLRSFAVSRNERFETSSWAKWKTFSQMLAIYLIYFWMIAVHSVAQGTSHTGAIAWIQDRDVIGKMMLFVTLFTVTTGMSYLYENRRHLKNLAIAFYRVFLPTNVR
ncbi:MAG: CDP-diacylglycerol--glycerol-3-phosphate 3-phosphatidyltransferase [bacterium]